MTKQDFLILLEKEICDNSDFDFMEKNIIDGKLSHRFAFKGVASLKSKSDKRCGVYVEFDDLSEKTCAWLGQEIITQVTVFFKTKLVDKEYCPRSVENGGGPDSPFKPPMNGEMTWREDDGSCSYCGSVNPDVLMARLEKGDISVIPTDKSYKLYIQNDGGEEFKQAYGDGDGNIVVRDHPQPKFYFQHLSGEQQTRFIELLNEKKIKIGIPGYFYRLPFFITQPKGELA